MDPVGAAVLMHQSLLRSLRPGAVCCRNAEILHLQESARRRCPEVGVPWVEASSIQRGHCEDIHVGVAAAVGPSSTLQSKVGFTPTWTACIFRVSPEVAGDRDFD